jgi:mRNA interferase MazF
VAAQASLRRDSDLLIDQLRTIDNQRLTGGPLAKLDAAAMALVAEAIREVLDLAD